MEGWQIVEILGVQKETFGKRKIVAISGQLSYTAECLQTAEVGDVYCCKFEQNDAGELAALMGGPFIGSIFKQAITPKLIDAFRMYRPTR